MSDPSEGAPDRAGGQTHSTMRSNIVGVVKLIVLFLFLKWALVDVYMIPSGSMEPTLHGVPGFFRGDRVAVNKLAFGPRVPFTTSRILPLGEPKRWDVVVFENVEPGAKNKILIKRVVGLPGERVHLADGKIHINDEVVEPPEALHDVLHYTTGMVASDEDVRRTFLDLAQASGLPRDMTLNHESVKVLREDVVEFHERVKDLDLESMSDSEQISAVEGVDPLSLQVIREWLEFRLSLNPEAAKQFRYGILEDDYHSMIPEGHYFLLGDNSGHSKDGRFFGWVPRSHLYGRAFAVVLPPTNLKDLSGFTSTGRGLVLLFSIPALIVLYEVTRAVRHRRAQGIRRH